MSFFLVTKAFGSRPRSSGVLRNPFTNLQSKVVLQDSWGSALLSQTLFPGPGSAAGERIALLDPTLQKAAGQQRRSVAAVLR